MLLTVAILTATACASAAGIRPRACDATKLDNSTSYYDITVPGTTVFDVAKATNRGVCDIGRENRMADVEVIPNVGQSLRIPAEVCEPDNESCLLPGPGKRECILGGPRLYYTFNGDTYTKIARRLNITVESIMCSGSSPCSSNGTEAHETLPTGQFVKVPLCDPSECTIRSFAISDKVVYKDLAEQYGATVGQIMGLSPTYNYSNGANSASPDPSISIPINCTLLDDDYQVLS